MSQCEGNISIPILRNYDKGFEHMSQSENRTSHFETLSLNQMELRTLPYNTVKLKFMGYQLRSELCSSLTSALTSLFFS